MSVFYNEEKNKEKVNEINIWSFCDAHRKLLKVATTNDKINEDVKSIFPWIGLDELREKKKLIIPRVIPAC